MGNLRIFMIYIFLFLLVSCQPSEQAINPVLTPYETSVVSNTVPPEKTATFTPKPDPTATQEIITAQVTKPTEPTLNQLPIEIPVLVITYYPPDAIQSEMLDYQETGINHSIAHMRQYVAQLVKDGARIASEGTRYHGYKEPEAPTYLSFKIIDQLEFLEAIPRGYPLDNSSFRPFYAQIFSEQQICNYVDQRGVREIWFYGYHSNTIVPDESRMSSVYGDISNSYPHEEDIPEQFRLPNCENSYTLYNFNYGREIETNIHNRLHQIENVIFFAENRGYPVNSENVKGSLFWDDFSFWGSLGNELDYRASCGNTHSGPNSVKDYVYSSREIKENNCETWHPDDSKTTYVLSNCSQWNCTEMGFYLWFMQNIPGYRNGIEFQGKSLRNWWDTMADFNQFINYDRSLFFDTSTLVGYPNQPASSGFNNTTNTTVPNFQSDHPVFEYPVDQQVLTYGGDYLFKVEAFPGAESYLWGFFQDGVMVWENLRDEGILSGNEFGLLSGSKGYDSLSTGEVQVMVRAVVGGQYTEAGIITIRIENVN